MRDTSDSSAGAVSHDLTVLPDLLDLGRSLIDPAAPAVGDGTDTLSYRDYTTAVGQLADALHDLQVQPGDRVGVHLHKGVASFVSVHAVLRVGAVMVPLDAFAPLEHTTAVVADAGIAVLVTDARQDAVDHVVTAAGLSAVVTRSEVTSSAVEVIAWSELAERRVADPVDIAPDDPAYIIYTSGSTGTPKGIVHSHRSALAYARLAATTYGLRPDDRLANIASLHFDQSTFELYAAPFAGSSVMVVPDAVLRFPASLSELIERERVTVWYSVPYVLRQLVTRGALEERGLSSIRWVLYGGESYPPVELAELMRALPGAAVSNVYGPAEVNQCARFDLTQPPSPDRPVPIGRAWDETELVIVDADDAPVVDRPGELLVSTVTMMDGYWNRPDLTSTAITERTFPECSGTRWYRTGDLAETNNDGDIVFLGRTDNQVKVRGQRVELEALDLTIREMTGVGEAAIVADVVDGDVSLVALVEPDGDNAVTLREVQQQVAVRHPRAAVPAHLLLVDRLARTATGKIDRNAALAQARLMRKD